MKKIVVSIVVPVFNEEWAIVPLWKKLAEIIDANRACTWRIVFVNDGSTDKTSDKLAYIETLDSSITIIELRENYGTAQAMQAGFDLVESEYVVCISANLENDPQDIPLLVEKLERGFDVCVGWRCSPLTGKLSRPGPRRLINWCISKLAGLEIHDYECALRAYRTKSVRPLRLSGNLDRYIPVFVHWRGGRVTEQKIKQLPLSHGGPKREGVIRRNLKVLFDLVFLRFYQRYSNKPLYVFGSLGLFGILIGFIALIFAVTYKITGQASFIETPLLLIAMLGCLSGLILFSLGILAEFLLQIYRLQLGKEFYVVSPKPRKSTGR